MQVIPAAGQGLEEHELQGKLRSSSDAFLAKKVIVCEGATEVGFLRGFDDYQVDNAKDPLSFHGAALLDVGGGAKVKAIAKAFKALHYNVTAFADGDADDQFSLADAKELTDRGIPVIESHPSQRTSVTASTSTRPVIFIPSKPRLTHNSSLEVQSLAALPSVSLQETSKAFFEYIDFAGKPKKPV